jgi:hypothetical protein
VLIEAGTLRPASSPPGDRADLPAVTRWPAGSSAAPLLDIVFGGTVQGRRPSRRAPLSGYSLLSANSPISGIHHTKRLNLFLIIRKYDS